MKKLLWILFLCWTLPHATLVQVQAQSVVENELQASLQTSQASTIFTDESVLNFTLSMNLKELLKDRGEERSYHQANITYKTPEGKTETVPLKVRVRGRHRRDPSVCRFPPLLLNFPKKAVANTTFAGTDKIKLVTHCIGDDYVLREYLVYKLYNIVSGHSFRVRLCYINYEDTEGRKDIGGSYAFLIEEEERLAERSKSSIVDDAVVIRMDATDEQSMARLALFQYMIGNTDWSVPYRHNIVVLFMPHAATLIPVPYDFDYNGMVMPPYAKPPPILELRSVRQRIFRGYTYSREVQEGLVPYFNNRKAAFYQVYDTPLIDQKYKSMALKYLDEFYEIINDPKDFRRYIVKQGERNQKDNIVVKGLDK